MHQTEVFEAGSLFTSATGIIRAPESSHALRVAIDEALECKRTGEKKTIFFNLSGHDLLDLSAYDEYNHGRLQDFELAEITFGH